MKLDANQISARRNVVSRYVQAWAEPDASLRLERLRSCFAGEGSYRDPTVSFEDLPSLDRHLADLHRKFPGCRVVQQDELETYDDVGRFRWAWSTADGTVRRRGVDFVRFSADDRLRYVVGFFDAP